ncbi:AMP-binding protein [Pseudopelagicola sp. nBUS_20]|uniref:AMP-binding protein n=1 Tax=Pseudopelagicola sp. nBUS_20 TaxID=3395317 RepID=UPI003EBF74DE
MFWENRCTGVDKNAFAVLEEKTYSYEETFAIADGLFSSCERGVALLLCSRNLETVVGYVGSLRKKLVPLLIDNCTRIESLNHYTDVYKPRYIFLPSAKAFLEGYEIKATFLSYVLLERIEDEDIRLDKALTLLLPTSGSTGDPKCVRLSAKNLDACVSSVCSYLDMGVDRRAVSLLPFHYSYGLSVLNNAMHSRSSIVLSEASVLERGFWQLLEKKEVTDFSAVPFIYETIKRLKFSEIFLENLVCMTQAGGPLDPKLTRHFYDVCLANNISYYTMYGQTEASPRISYVPPDQAMLKLGSVGIPISCGEAFLAETFQKTGKGELVYKGDNVCLGYSYSKEDLCFGDELNGVLYTGDQVEIDQDGFIWIVGRRKRFIKVQGLSVNLDHVETVLRQQEPDCVVIGKENKIIVVHTHRNTTALEDCIDANFQFHRSNIKLIHELEIPLNDSGKIHYVALTKKYL